MARYVHLSLDDDETLEKLAVALSSKVRRDILRMIDEKSYNVIEIADKLKIPISTASFHVKALENASLVNIQTKPGQRGISKIVSRKIDNINIQCILKKDNQSVNTYTLSVPVGSFADAMVKPSCGIASEENIIEFDDMPGVFFSPERLKAQIIWFSQGYIEYKIPNYFLKKTEPISLSFSMELCSEAPNYRNDWKSDITFWLNGKEVCTWTSPGDLGGRRGRLNPRWWSDMSTQYGVLKTVRIDNTASYLDENNVSTASIGEFGLCDGDYFTLRIGVKPDAKNLGGVNLFGDKFGDYSQGILMRFDFIPLMGETL